MVEISNEELIKSLIEIECDLSEYENKDILLDICKQRSKTVEDLKAQIENIIYRPTSYNEKDVEEFIEEGVNYMLHSYVNLLDNKRTTIKSTSQLEEMTKPFIEHNSLKLEELYGPVKLALAGKIDVPSIYELILILGVEETMKRIEEAIYEDFGRDIEW